MKRNSFALLAIILIPLATIASAQDSSETTPECNPGRPTVATPATLTPVGYLQFENGGMYASGSSEFATQSSVSQVTKLAVSPRIQLLSLSGPYAFSKAADGSGSSDAGSFSAGLQAVLLPGAGKRPTVAASYLHLFYAGTAPDIDIGTDQNTAILLVSDDLGSFHFDLNGFLSEQTQAALRRAQFGEALSISHPLGKKATIGGELWYFSQPLDRGNAVGNLWCVSYAIRKNLVVDAGFNRGLTGSSTQWEGVAGFTYLLPHRLWPAHRAQ